jgi:hypothetical protein
MDFNRRLEADLDADSRQELDSIFQGLSQTTPMRDRTIEGTSTSSRILGTTTLNTVSTTSSSNKRLRVESGGLSKLLHTTIHDNCRTRSCEKKRSKPISTANTSNRNDPKQPDGLRSTGRRLFWSDQTPLV